MHSTLPAGVKEKRPQKRNRFALIWNQPSITSWFNCCATSLFFLQIWCCIKRRSISGRQLWFFGTWQLHVFPRPSLANSICSLCNYGSLIQLVGVVVVKCECKSDKSNEQSMQIGLTEEGWEKVFAKVWPTPTMTPTMGPTPSMLLSYTVLSWYLGEFHILNVERCDQVNRLDSVTGGFICRTCLIHMRPSCGQMWKYWFYWIWRWIAKDQKVYIASWWLQIQHNSRTNVGYMILGPQNRCFQRKSDTWYMNVCRKVSVGKCVCW